MDMKMKKMYNELENGFYELVLEYSGGFVVNII